MKTFVLASLLLFITALQGCTTVVDATTREPIQPDPGKRSIGTYIDDKRLQVIVGVNIRKASPALKKSHIEVTSFNGVILLTGQVPDNAMRQLASETATSVPNVRQVYNELQPKPNTKLLTRTNDSWIATKVKTVLVADKNIDHSKIKSVTEDGTVYLMGLVTREQADQIANKISNIRGVREVVRVFEYVEGG